MNRQPKSFRFSRSRLIPFFASRMGLSVKLALGFFVILLIFSSVAVFNNFRMEQLEAKDAYERKQAERQRLAMELKSMVQELDSYAAGYMVSKNAEFIERYNSESAELENLVRDVSATASNSDQRQWGARLTAISKEFTANFEKVQTIAENTELAGDEKQSALESAYAASQLHKQTIFDLVDWFYEDYTLEAEAAKEDTSALLTSTRWVVLLSAGASVLAGAALAAAILLSFTRGIRNISRAVQWMSEGDLRHEVGSRSNDELGRLSAAFDAGILQMKQSLLQTKSVAESLRSHSLQLLDFTRNTAEANDLILLAMEEAASGASKQAAQAEHSASVIRQLQESMASIEASANVLALTGADANRYAEDGGSLVAQLVAASQTTAGSLEAMRHALHMLESRSSEITGITGTIADISEQTNILALNASIESARAGEHGRGFAVIADQIRKLSSQTGQSSKRIDDILSDLRRQIADVGKLMTAVMESLLKQNGKLGETSETFSAIFDVISAFGEKVRHIHEQVAVTKESQEQLAASVHIVASIAQQTAAGVQETAASAAHQNQSVGRIAVEAQDLSALSETIFAEINKFKIET
ncbi:methyl-accepting chemotaxis protein [Paenibacillus thermotolerans]|uniref:methyl-accepting chemotaxis protein n=1 Tax=Paenibacillus thermotolerans TaxID=3027807 RepID=UPI002368006C|nr:MULTISPECIES: HAMP domain-containing methyl-accepting chemotaxis protein [unclassified Paenibacillus]